MLINNLVFDGKHHGGIDVRSPNVPVADFVGYRNDPSTIPTRGALQTSTINTNRRGVKIPVMYNANASRSMKDYIQIGFRYTF